jgi:hypothetical protein
MYPFQIALWAICAMLHVVLQSHDLLFESLVMQSYPQMQSSLMDQLHKHDIASLLVDVRSDVV